MAEPLLRLQRIVHHLAPGCCAAAGSSSQSSSQVLVEFFFDCTSPWSYLAFSRIRELCALPGVELHLRPVLVGGVFNTANKEVYATRDGAMARAAGGGPSAKDIWSAKDAVAWASFLNLDIKSMLERFQAPTRSGGPGHPVSAVKVMRGATVAQEEGDAALCRYAFAAFDAYWGRLLDVSEDEVLKLIHTEAKLTISLSDFMQRLSGETAKAKLRKSTEELVQRGGFGTPTVFISRPSDPSGFVEEMHFGNDRMELVKAAILRALGKPWRFQETSGVPPP